MWNVVSDHSIWMYSRKKSSSIGASVQSVGHFHSVVRSSLATLLHSAEPETTTAKQPLQPGTTVTNCGLKFKPHLIPWSWSSVLLIAGLVKRALVMRTITASTIHTEAQTSWFKHVHSIYLSFYQVLTKKHCSHSDATWFHVEYDGGHHSPTTVTNITIFNVPLVFLRIQNKCTIQHGNECWLSYICNCSNTTKSFKHCNLL